MQNSFENASDKPTVGFDFDKTLTYRDTLAGYFFYIGKKRYGFLNFAVRALMCFSGMVLSKFKIISNDQMKAFGIRLFLRGLDHATLDTWSAAYAQTIRLNRVYATEFLQKNPAGLIISASFEAYLKHIFPKNCIVAAKIAYDNSGFVEKLGTNCYGVQKVEALRALGIHKLDTFYTDSYADKPVMDVSKNVFLVKGDVTSKLK